MGKHEDLFQDETNARLYPPTNVKHIVDYLNKKSYTSDIVNVLRDPSALDQQVLIWIPYQS